MFKRLIAVFVIFAFTFSNVSYNYAQEFNVDQLPVPGVMVGISEPFAPLAIKGIAVNPQKPLEFQFIVDTGKGPQDRLFIKEEANKLVKYFLAGLTIPEEDLWVNLSPYEKDHMITQALGQTDLGRDLLAQDYILKQLTASLIYPENVLGKEFWSRVYARAKQQFGTTDIPVNTFNKVWILPKEAQVFENGGAAYITKSTFKVMLEEDYLALRKNAKITLNDTHSIGVNIVRQIVLPEIEKEVNTGRNFAPLRQIYDAMILAKWYKETIQNSLLDAVYTNKKKTAGVGLMDLAVKEKIYQRYLQAYKKGVFNYIKEEPAPDGQTVPRKYFSGGISKLEPEHVDTNGPLSAVKKDGAMINITVTIIVVGFTTLVGAGIYSLFAQRPMRELARRINEKEALERAEADKRFISYIEEFKSGHREKLVSNLFHRLTEKWNFKIGALKARLSAEEFKELRDLLGHHILYDLDSRLRSSSYDDMIIEEAETISSKPEGDLLLTDEVKSLINVRKLVVKRLHEMDAPMESLPESRIRGTDPLSLAGLNQISKILASGRDFNITSEIIEEPHNTGEPIYLDYIERVMEYTIGIKDTDSAMIGQTLARRGNKLSDNVMNGGIDLNQINVKRTGKTINMQFDQAQLNELEQDGFEGFKPVITNITRISSPLPLLGISSSGQEEILAKA